MSLPGFEPRRRRGVLINTPQPLPSGVTEGDTPPIIDPRSADRATAGQAGMSPGDFALSGRDVPDYFGSMEEYMQRDRVESDPSAPAREEVGPPPHLGELGGESRVPHAGELRIKPPDALAEMMRYTPSPTFPVDKGEEGQLPHMAVEPADGANYDFGEPAEMTPPPSHALEVPYSRRERMQQEYDALAADTDPKDKNGKWVSLLLNGLAHMSRNAQAVSETSMRTGRPVDAYGMAAIAGGFGGGAVAGVADPRVDERMRRESKMGKLEVMIKAQVEREKAEQEAALRAAQVEREKANTEWLRARPDLEREKGDRQRLTAEGLRIFRILGSLKGQKLDPADPRVRQLQADADRANIPFDVESFNNSKGNFVRYPKVNPDHPERTVTVERNLVTGEEKVLGQAGWVAPRNGEGMTASEVKSNEDRDATRNNTEAYRRELLGLNSERLRLQMTNGMGAQAKRVFDLETKGLFERRRKIEQDITDYRKRAAAFTIDPADAERRVGELQKELEGVTDSIEASRGKAVSATPAPVDARPARPSASRPGRFAGRRMSRSNLPAAAKELGLSEAEAEALIKREGGTIY